jgi:hypothetical protein
MIHDDDWTLIASISTSPCMFRDPHHCLPEFWSTVQWRLADEDVVGWESIHGIVEKIDASL